MESIAGIKVGYGGKTKRGTHNKCVVDGATRKGSRFWGKLGFFCMCMSPKEEGSSSDKECIKSKVNVNLEADDVTREGRISTTDNFTYQRVTSRFSSTKSSRSYARSCTLNMEKELAVTSSLLRRFTFLDLMLATRSFKAENFHSEDGSETVLMGWVSPHGNFATRAQTGIQVAVKSLNLNEFQDHKEWLAEISYLNELNHPNLVKLIGFCSEDDKRLLVYEHVCRGSLESHLFNGSACLPWSIRMKIAIGVANGLAFLQEETSRPLTFRNFRTTNILLDMDYNAKLFDFGLSNDALMATQGYATPEYLMTGHITPKSNVFSFGVVLLELVTGRRVIDNTMSKGEQNLVEWLHLLLQEKDNFFYLIDSKLKDEFCMKEARRVMRLATKCLRHDPQTRPLMSQVAHKLKSLYPRDNGDMAFSSSSIPLPSVHQMHGGLSNHNKFGRYRIDPLRQDYPLPLPSPSVAYSSNSIV